MIFYLASGRSRSSLLGSPSLKLALLVFLTLFSSSALFSQKNDAPAQTMSARELRARANALLSQGAFSEAIQALEELISILGESKKKDIVQSMEAIYYKLGVCHFFTGSFNESEKAFTNYIKKYPKGFNVTEASVYIADGYRFLNNHDKAIKEYNSILKKFDRTLTLALRIDVMCSLARCHLAKDEWAIAIPLLQEIYRRAPDSSRRNWAATLCAVAYLKENRINDIYVMIPYLLGANSFASRSAAFNIAALECGDRLFAEEMFRDSLWIYRLVFQHDLLIVNAEKFLAKLQKKSERTKGTANLRELMHIQERIGETEAEIKALESIDNYDNELTYRIARSYMETRRYREAREIYLYLHETLKKDQAEECLYFAFRCCLPIQEWKRAFEIGEDYMKKYPSGEYFDPLTLVMGQLYAKLQDWPEVIRHFTKTLEISPKHEDAAECMFLLGYANFMEEKFEESVKWLSKMNKEHPGNPREEDSIYWLGMSLLFDKKYEEASMEFDHLLQQFAETNYKEDASFRRATCDYGLSKYKEAEPLLKDFVAAYPKSKLTGEAYMMLADIAGVDGDLKRSVELYKEVQNHEINIELYNYCMFRCGEMLFNDIKDYDGTIGHFQEYIARNMEGSNIPQAIFYIGQAYWQKGEQAGALQYFKEALDRYGDDRKALGIDLILEEWIGKAKAAPKNIGDQAWLDLKTAMKKARQDGRKVLSLRLQRALLYEPGVEDEERKKVLAEILSEENLPNAGPAVLQLIIDEAGKLGNKELARKAADEMIKAFTETDYALDARMFLAQEAILNKDYENAEKHLNVIREVFATSGEAAMALCLLGDMYLDQKKYDKADEAYKAILAVKEWKGKIWPEALYGRAKAMIGLNKLDKACAYLERIYLMYSHYKNWAAKAYLLRAESLKKMRMYKEATETLEDMLKNPELGDMPETKEAVKELETLRKRI